MSPIPYWVPSFSRARTVQEKSRKMRKTALFERFPPSREPNFVQKLDVRTKNPAPGMSVTEFEIGVNKESVFLHCQRDVMTL